ncbi:phosphate ABC transporter permease subunit PstC [Candidatus Mesenet endosymbiont of Agriotes lineatus]|uniref:phosphate ABC transporter permease subunit PstC n=1 Tax=Candidatus Mesenet endosymbiont of Agriotes lineatus TaxID=3077948 RepID=UPI003977BB94
MIMFFLIFLLSYSLFFCKKVNCTNKARLHCLFILLLTCFSLMLFLYSSHYNLVCFIFILFLSLIVIDKKHKILKYLLFFAIAVSFSVTLCILSSVFFQSLVFFNEVPISKFLFSSNWNHNATIFDDNIANDFGIVPLLVGTLLVTVIAILVAVPAGLFSAVYIGEYANKRVRYVINMTLEILSAIPTIVYGYFAVIFLSPFIKKLAELIGLSVQSENALVAGVAIGIMIFPFVTSLMEDAIRSVPKSLRYGFMALGATSAETVWHITLPYAFPTIISSILLAISRAVGETMIVLMTVGINAQLTFNPLRSVTTVTVQIATLLTGDQDFNSIQTLAAYALSLTLFVITWSLNAIALFIIKRK